MTSLSLPGLLDHARGLVERCDIDIHDERLTPVVADIYERASNALDEDVCEEVEAVEHACTLIDRFLSGWVPPKPLDQILREGYAAINTFPRP